MNDKYEIPTLNIEDLNLSDTLTTISPLETVDFGAVSFNGTTAADLTWHGSGGYTTSAIPNVVIGTGATGSTGNFTWTTTPNVWTTVSAAGTNPQTNQAGKLTLQGENADIDINGKSMKAWMEKVEERLNILTPNTELEKDWDELRRLGERYRKLEKKCKEKAKMWEELKKIKPTGI